MSKFQLRLIVLLVLPVSGAHAQTPAPQPEELLETLRAEMVQGLARREVRDAYDRYQSYSSSRLDASAADAQFSDKTGNCRLAWFGKLLRNQLDAPLEAERLSRDLHEALRADHVARSLDLMAQKLDAVATVGEATQDQDALAQLKGAMRAARRAFEAAMAPLTEAQRMDLRQHLYGISTAQINGSGAMMPDRAGGRRMCDLIEAMDRKALHAAAKALVPLAAGGFLSQLPALPSGQSAAPQGVKGPVHKVVDTSHGTILIGGRGDNTYDLDAMADVCAVVDLGGRDVYREGVVSESRPVLVLIDLSGDDRYVGVRPGIQGAAIGGVSLLVDVCGDDVYDAQDVAQGTALAGIGLLIDFAGDDSYAALRRAQGSAMGGIGLLVDRGGDDRYHAALFAQGFGGPLGFGVLDDRNGADHYYAGGRNPDGYDDTPGYAGWSQGVGAGARGSANGGIGVLLDGGGDDIYEADYFSHGGAYWFAVGIARDFSGNDRRLGSTRLAHDGSEREQPIYLRWGVGWQAHYGLGFVIDDEGDDQYGGNIVGLAFSWDVGLAALLDLDGNDQYLIDHSQAHAQEVGLAILFDVAGDDTYRCPNPGSAAAAVSYHPMPECGGNFAFAVDYGGNDTRVNGPRNDCDLEVGWPGGFLIDRAQVPGE